jgi:hypothetical protein
MNGYLTIGLSSSGFRVTTTSHSGGCTSLLLYGRRLSPRSVLFVDDLGGGRVALAYEAPWGRG